MQSMELPLVVFTVLSQAAVGMALLWPLRADGVAATDRREGLFAVALLGLALVASLFHLGHPLGAVRTLDHLGGAWLSREILAFSAFGALLALAAFTGKRKGAWGALLALVGFGALYTSGMTYAPPSLPALHNALPLTLFVLCAILLGGSFGSWFAPEESQRALRTVVIAALAASLAVNVAAPCVFASGTAAMAATSQAWLDSPFYWVRIVAGIIVPLFIATRTKTLPAGLALLILLGELAGRVVFFGETVHTATFIGMPQ